MPEIKKGKDFILENEHAQVIQDCVKSLEDMSYFLRFKDDDTMINSFRNLNKIVDKEVKRIKTLDFKALDQIIDNKHKCVSFLYKKLVDMKSKSQEVNYDYYDKLTGFMTKRGRFKWSNDKIDELFVSLMK
ncbi:hypothetical protein NBO_788g0001 [Nosema bombycis CQ1]|uniref:Apoptosis-antagonizing transcription factor C-terminal domain-containing protein n=1 Tax=Nosema bombycis (strain CQ1 / CVCC 102059) TaxID=578461 RepID=R0M1B9_NOSB1|nr:hypothetical protein NBO_788g0001 [Nosema bombycis CQ1]|eukprot:EOB11814.1 hypothetical protein NBO_788g0001 [Nosema bombycis CQ1]